MATLEYLDRLEPETEQKSEPSPEQERDRDWWIIKYAKLLEKRPMFIALTDEQENTLQNTRLNNGQSVFKVLHEMHVVDKDAKTGKPKVCTSKKQWSLCDAATKKMEELVQGTSEIDIEQLEIQAEKAYKEEVAAYRAAQANKNTSA